MNPFPDLPVFRQLDEITRALSTSGKAVISAEPGAGKTMLVPVLVRELAPPGLTILVEPRRIAARAAAYGIARMHNFTAGTETGFAVRGEQLKCNKNGILAVTPGILLQMLQNDPFLSGVSAVVFDEFHERSLESDLALTLTLDASSSLRDDLLLIVMSATMDSERAGAFINAPVITVPGRSFPIDIRYRETPADLRELPRHTARAILENIHSTDGNILVFLPGAEEIRQTRLILEPALDENFTICPLHGSLSLEEQRAAIAPLRDSRRKIILATNVAESSLTIDSVRCVIDSGWEKRAVWHPGAQMTFLEYTRITKASAAQRAGRAGRTAPGIAIRCYNRFTFEQFHENITPEILNSELSSLLLAVSCWGSDVNTLSWLDAPPAPAVAAATELLRKLGLFSAENRPTPAGQRAATLPVSPRIAAMMILSPPSLRRSAAAFAAILEEKDDFRRFNSADLLERVAKMLSSPQTYRLQYTIFTRLLKEFPPASPQTDDDPGLPIALAFPEWIARNRSAHGTVFQLANGSAAKLQEDDFLRQSPFLAVARLDGNSSSANSAIRLAVPIEKSTIELFFAHRISEYNSTSFENDKISSFCETKLDELTLSRRPCPVPPGAALPALIKECSRRLISLPPPENKRSCALFERIRFAHSCGMDELPDLNDPAGFFISISHFFPPEISSINELKKADFYTIIRSAVDFSLLTELDRLCPEYFTAPSGHKFRIDYSAGEPTLPIIIQELYGIDSHPCVGRNRIPLRLELLSPARRPVQITSDLPGFWRGSWSLVRTEMRGRYPKHLWPETPYFFSREKK